MIDEQYHQYLASREWSVLKEAVKRRSGGWCERCKINSMNHVHHLTYARKYHELLEDLQALCKGCHEFTHAKSDIDPAEDAKPILYCIGKTTGKKWEVLKPIIGDTAKLIASDQDHENFHYNDRTLDGAYGETYGIVKEQCIDRLRQADAGVGYIDTPDSFGSIAEIAYLSALGKPTFIICGFPADELRTRKEHECFHKTNQSQMEDAYWLVFHFPNVRFVSINEYAQNRLIDFIQEVANKKIATKRY